MKKLIKKASISFSVVLFSLGTLTGCSSQSSKKSTSSSKQNITVSYVLKENNKTFSSKKLQVKKNATVLQGLKKGWKVQESKGFVTSIDGKKQNTKKKTYWTYTVNKKWANAANKVKLHKNDKVVWTLGKVGK